MNKNKCLVFTTIGLFFVLGCGKPADKPQQDVIDLTGEDAEISTIVTSEGTAVVQQPQAPVPVAPQVAVPEVPAEKDIQLALKNAGLYDGPIDGKIGPKSRKAIEDFQAANGLKVDGKVGKMTWEKLSVYLNVSAEPAGIKE